MRRRKDCTHFDGPRVRVTGLLVLLVLAAACGSSDATSNAGSASNLNPNGGGGNNFGDRLPDTAVAPDQIKTGQATEVRCTWADNGTPVETAGVVVTPQGGEIQASGGGVFTATFSQAGMYAVACKDMTTGAVDASPAKLSVLAGDFVRSVASMVPASVEAGQSSTLTCTGYDAGDNPGLKADWVVTLDPADVATVSKPADDGTYALTGAKLGTTSVTCKLADKPQMPAEAAALTVVAGKIASVTAVPPKGPVVVGDTAAIACVARDAGGNTIAVPWSQWTLVVQSPLTLADPAAGQGVVFATKAGDWPVRCVLESPKLASDPAMVHYVAGPAEKVAAKLDPVEIKAGDAGSKVSCELQDAYGNTTLVLQAPARPGDPPVKAEFKVDPGADLTVQEMTVTSTKAGEHDVRCSVVGKQLIQVPAKLKVLAGDPDFSKVTLQPDKAPVDTPIQASCAAYDKYGNPVQEPIGDWKMTLPSHCTNKGGSFSCTAAGAFDIKCETDKVNDAVAATVTILPGPPATLQLVLDPDKPNYPTGQTIQVKGVGSDKHGNAIADVPLQSLTLNPKGGAIDQVNAQLSFEVDGLYTLTAAAQTAPSLKATRQVRVDSSGPLINITTPTRGATLLHTGKQKVTFSVVDELSGLGSVTVNGVDIKPGDGIGITTSIPTGYGMNLIKIVAKDEWGNTASVVQSFYAAKKFLATTTGSGTNALVPSGLVAWLGQTAIDSGVHNHKKPKDIATVLEIVLKNLDTSIVVGKSFKVDASLLKADAKVTSFKFGNNAINGGYPKMTLTAVNGGLNLIGTMYNIAAKVNIKGTTLFFVPVDIDSDVTASSMTITGTVKVTIDAAGKVKVATQNVTVKLNGLNVKISNSWGFLVNWLIGLFNNQITSLLESELQKQIATAIDGPLASALQAFALNTSFEVPGFFGGSPTPVTLSSALSTLSFYAKSGSKHGGGKLGLKASLTSVKKVKHNILGSLARQNCMAGGQASVALQQSHPMELALHFDLINQLLAAIWQAGSLQMNVDPSALGAFDFTKYAIQNLKVTTDFLLPPLISDCTSDGKPEMQLGDVGLDIAATMDGQPVVLKVYLSAAAKVTVKSVKGLNGNEIALDLAKAHVVEADVDSVLVGGKAAPEGTVAFFEALLPALTNLLLEQFKGTLGSFPLPELDLTMISQTIPKGTAIAIDVQQVFAEPGHVVAEGGVK